MIAIDSSALIAIAWGEPEADQCRAAIKTSTVHLIGTPTLLETRIVLTARLGSDLAAQTLTFLIPEGCQIVAFNDIHLTAAMAAFDRFGKGRHPASLNYGDCMAYAVARVAACPLLYKGEDFARTDIRSAL